jgi:hypothetical protein
MPPAFQLHDRVFQHRFGDGRVTKVRAVDGDHEVTVEFSWHGEKTFLARVAKLEKVLDEGTAPVASQAKATSMELAKPKAMDVARIEP